MARLLKFENRWKAGELLAQHLSAYAGRSDVVVLALPRGGVPVGYVIARALRAPLDLVLVRKLGVPGFQEHAMGAVASGGLRVLQEDVIAALAVPPAAIEQATGQETQELQRRERLYRSGAPPQVLQQQVAILVDDGLATGATMQAAVMAVRREQPARIVVAVPVGSREAVRRLRAEVDELICLQTPSPFYAVGLWYDNFDQVGDDEVIALLRRAAQPGNHGAAPDQVPDITRNKAAH